MCCFLLSPLPFKTFVHFTVCKYKKVCRKSISEEHMTLIKSDTEVRGLQVEHFGFALITDFISLSVVILYVSVCLSHQSFHFLCTNSRMWLLREQLQTHVASLTLQNKTNKSGEKLTQKKENHRSRSSFMCLCFYK